MNQWPKVRAIRKFHGLKVLKSDIKVNPLAGYRIDIPY